LEEFISSKTEGGTLLELMPGHPKKVIDELEQQLARVPSLTHLMEAGAEADDLIAPFFGEKAYSKIDDQLELKYGCRCTKERALDSMILFTQSEIDEMAAETR
jgi:molecular chaperone Hsp33